MPEQLRNSSRPGDCTAQADGPSHGRGRPSVTARAVRRCRLRSAVLLSLSAPWLVAYGQAPIHPHEVVMFAGDEPVVEVHHEPHHRQVFQRGPMRILDLQIPPGERSWFHTHDWPVFYLTLSASAARLQNHGEEWSGGGAAVASDGEAVVPPPLASPRISSTISYVDEPITHRLENVGHRLFRAMVVVNETLGNETVSAAVAGFDSEPDLENPWFRAYRFTLAPGETTPSHRHDAPVVIFQATAGSGLGIGAMTFEFNDAGQWAYFEPGDPHQVRNTGDVAVEFVEVEVRRP